MSTKQRRILMTTALPYANGSLHLGHILEYTQADIWARFHRQQGHHCLFICGSDAHGTPVMLTAKKQGISPEALVKKIHAEFEREIAGFGVLFDNFYTTHSAENHELAVMIYQRLAERGDILKKTITQAFDPIENIFLPDRFIKGQCPRCNSPDQYGDNCEVCGASYSPAELINAVSAISGATPTQKQSEHFFFQLEHYRELLEKWIHEDHLQPEVVNKLKEWFHDKLRDWDISRDAPYFGFEIPDAPGKYFYVWLDAPIGYMASLKNLADKDHTVDFSAYWQKETDTELYHFVGKDIVYFHALFWPAMLHGANLRMPTGVFVHGYLTINGTKMSKSRGTFITAKKYLAHLNPEFLRYYFAAKLTAQIEDIDLNLNDFKLRVNADLVGKYINLASRCAGFITKKFNGQLAKQLQDQQLFNTFIQAGQSIQTDYAALNYNKAIREIMALADQANQYIDKMKPWALAKDDSQLDNVQAICTQGLNLFKVLTTYLKPILPITAQKVEAFLNCDPLDFANANLPLLNHRINTFKPLMTRIDDETLEKLTQPDHHE